MVFTHAEVYQPLIKFASTATLVNVLVELANDHEPVQARLTRLQLADRPDKLASGFRNTGGDQRLRGEAVIYRALLTAVLSRAHARAYPHAASYLGRLQEIAGTGIGLQPLESHEAFEAAIRLQHARKTAFRAHVNGQRSDRIDRDEQANSE